MWNRGGGRNRGGMNKRGNREEEQGREEARSLWCGFQGGFRVYFGMSSRATKNRSIAIGKGIGTEVGKGIGKEVGKVIGKEVGKGIGTEVGKGIGTEVGKGIAPHKSTPHKALAFCLALALLWWGVDARAGFNPRQATSPPSSSPSGSPSNPPSGSPSNKATDQAADPATDRDSSASLAKTQPTNPVIGVRLSDPLYAEARRALFDFNLPHIKLLPNPQGAERTDILIRSEGAEANPNARRHPKLSNHWSRPNLWLELTGTKAYSLKARLQDQLLPAVSYACDGLGIASFVLVAPVTEQAAIQAISGEVERCGGQMVRRFIYKRPLNALTAQQLSEDIFSGFLSLDQLKELEELELTEPLEPPFEAVVIATEDADELLMLAGAIPYGRVQLIAGNVMENPSLAGETLLYGGLFGGGITPVQIAYDATALALASCGAGDCQDMGFLAKPSGFRGTGGLFRLTDPITQPGATERLLATFTLTNQGIRQVAEPKGEFPP